jgi:alpha-L-rhamnosidase
MIQSNWRRKNMGNEFIMAKPIWAKGQELEKNITCGFRAVFNWNGSKEVVFRAAASCIYRFFVNGEFAGAGPARGPHGFYRVDECSLANCLRDGENIVAVEVAGYNINSFSLLDQPSFLQAEIISGGRVMAATGESGEFTCSILMERVQKVQRYSFQRAFAECYHMNSSFNAWCKDLGAEFLPVDASAVEEKNLIPRNLPPFSFPVCTVLSVVEIGIAHSGSKPKKTFTDRSLKDIGEELKGFTENELEVHLTEEALAIETQCNSSGGGLPVALPGNAYALFDFGVDKTGFVGVEISCAGDSEVYLLFDEILSDGDVDFTRMSCCNVIKYSLKAGDYDLLSFEPYTMKYLKVVTLVSPCVIYNAFLRENVCPVPVTAVYEGNENFRKIYDAAVETFRQNCTDIYMDCPSRERAGWLCDSFFISRVEYALTGGSAVEHNFLENFLLPETFPFLPEGMLPMCYPSDHIDGSFIPNWALWFVVELEEYLKRSCDRALVDAFKPKIYGLFDYFRAFLNEYGLLEKLEGWVFVEWSKANELTQDVSFPTNMLYAGALDAAGRLFRDESLLKQAVGIRNIIRKISYDGEFFVDNALRRGDKLVRSGERTETCQYYAFFFDIAVPSTHGWLWKVLTESFGPQRKQTGEYPEIYPSNAFIGNYLRLDILSRYEMREKLLAEMEGYFDYMVDKTGTLWENITDYASCNHGFASYVACLLLKQS